MTVDVRMRSDRERALRWLESRLVWEEILATLRDARAGGPAQRVRREPESEAA